MLHGVRVKFYVTTFRTAKLSEEMKQELEVAKKVRPGVVLIWQKNILFRDSQCTSSMESGCPITCITHLCSHLDSNSFFMFA